MTPDFADLHLLVILGQTRSFTQTARRLELSRASVSMRIAALERAVGVPLVHRTTRAVALTEAGSQLVAEIDASFAHIAQSVEEVKELAGAPRGLIRVSAPVALGRQVLAPALPGFLTRHPEIRIDLDLTDRFVNLAQDGFDLAIRHAEAPPENYVAWTLCETRSLLVASRDYLSRRGAPQRPEELAEHDCLMYLRPGAERTWRFERAAARRRAEAVSVAVSGQFKVNNSEVLREAVLGGLGIGLLPDFSAREGLAQGGLVPVLPAWTPVGFFGDKLYAVRPWAPRVPLAVRRLVDHLVASFASGFAVTPKERSRRSRRIAAAV